MFGSDGQEKMSGASGFDWANYKFEQAGVTVDMLLQIDRSTPATPSTSALLDLFSFVEGLVGLRLRRRSARHRRRCSPTSPSPARKAASSTRPASRGSQACRTCSAPVSLRSRRQHHPRRRGQRHHRGPRRRRHHRRRPLARRARERARCERSRRRDPQRRQHTGAHPGHALGRDQSEPARDRARDRDGAGPDYDTAMFSGARANYTVAIAFDGTVTVTDDFGTRFTQRRHRYPARHRAFAVRRCRHRSAGRSIQCRAGRPTDDLGHDTRRQSDAIGFGLGRHRRRYRRRLDRRAGRSRSTGRSSGRAWPAHPERIGKTSFCPNSLGGGATAAQGPTLPIARAERRPADRGRAHPRSGGISGRQRRAGERLLGADRACCRGRAGRTLRASRSGPSRRRRATACTSFAPTSSSSSIRSSSRNVMRPAKTCCRSSATSACAYGLRTVDGTFNNLVTGQSGFGASDNNFPLLLDQVFRNDLDGDALDTNGPAPGGVINNTNYATTTNVVDADPRIISNLIADQTASNPAAALAAKEANPFGGLTISPGLDGVFGTADDRPVFEIPNVKPDAGLSAPFNSWMTMFGQFFDHGLDLLDKGGNGTVYIPLQADDPLIAGTDGVFGNRRRSPREPALHAAHPRDATRRCRPARMACSTRPTTSTSITTKRRRSSIRTRRTRRTLRIRRSCGSTSASAIETLNTGRLLEGSARRARDLARHQGTGARPTRHHARPTPTSSMCRCSQPTRTATSSSVRTATLRSSPTTV